MSPATYSFLGAALGEWMVAHLWALGVMAVLAAVFFLGKYVLGLPLRREENSRLFLDVLELGLKRGQQLEETFLSLARSGDRTLQAVASSQQPWVLGIVHILLGLLGLGMSVVGLLNEVTIENDPWTLGVWGAGMLASVLYIGAGVQLIRHRSSGRRLGIGLAVSQLVLVLGVTGLFFLGGQVEEGLVNLLGTILPTVLLLCLTSPRVAAVCGRDGKQPPPLVAHLQSGMGLLEALRKTPGIVEPRLLALLEVGGELGDLRKIMPTARAALAGATGKVRKAQNYFMVLALVVTPMTLVILPMMAVYILPKFQAIIRDMGVAAGSAPLFDWAIANLSWLASVHGMLMTVLWLGVLHYLAGPRFRAFANRFAPRLIARLELLLPWKRKRVSRDFSMLLAMLLDAGLPEERAVELAADSTANAVFQSRAAEACADLQNGASLPEALRRMDASGEFHWRLDTAARAGQGFLPALRAWHEALDARAFQQEQAAAQVATTSLVFYNGALVGLVMACVFQLLLSVISEVGSW